MKNKRAKLVFLNVATNILLHKGTLGSGIYTEYLEYCEYDGKLKAFNHWEEPRAILEGIVGSGSYKLGIISLTANQLKGIK